MSEATYASRRDRRRRRRQTGLIAALAVATIAILAGAYFLNAQRTGETTPNNAENASVEAPQRVEQQAGGGPAPEKPAGGATAEEPRKGSDPSAGAANENKKAVSMPEKPEAVKGIYIIAHSGSEPNLSAYIDFINSNELNALVVDVKDVTGEVMYPSKVPLAREIGATRDVIPDIKALAGELEENDIYSIARISVFEDDLLPRQRPDLAAMDSATGLPWRNSLNQTWADSYDREVWEYNVAVAKEAAEAGFDEVQFDYVRFPSDGPMETLTYEEETFPTEADAIAGFLEYARSELNPMGVYVAADVFGLAAGDNGAGVGQDITKIAQHVDVLSPMAYPSHYPVGSYGYDNPNAEPYGVLENTLAEFEADIKDKNPDLELRPWLQDFDYGTPPDYGPTEVKAQKQAVYDSGKTSWLLWNPDNLYTEEAMEPPPEEEQR